LLTLFVFTFSYKKSAKSKKGFLLLTYTRLREFLRDMADVEGGGGGSLIRTMPDKGGGVFWKSIIRPDILCEWPPTLFPPKKYITFFKVHALKWYYIWPNRPAKYNQAGKDHYQMQDNLCFERFGEKRVESQPRTQRLSSWGENILVDAGRMIYWNLADF
jgi:hypothetical protein